MDATNIMILMLGIVFAIVIITIIMRHFYTIRSSRSSSPKSSRSSSPKSSRSKSKRGGAGKGVPTIPLLPSTSNQFQQYDPNVFNKSSKRNPTQGLRGGAAVK